MSTVDHELDPLLAALGTLAADDVGPERAARLRARCHAALARRRRDGAPAGPGPGASCGRLLAPALVLIACAAYLAEIARRAAALLGP